MEEARGKKISEWLKINLQIINASIKVSLLILESKVRKCHP